MIVLVSYQRLLIPVLVLVIYSMIYHKNLFIATLKENSTTLVVIWRGKEEKNLLPSNVDQTPNSIIKMSYKCNYNYLYCSSRNSRSFFC